MGKKSFNNSIIGIQTRTYCQCGIAYQVQGGRWGVGAVMKLSETQQKATVTGAC